MSLRTGSIASPVKQLLAWLALFAIAPACAGAASLYTGPGPRPGPDLLYEKRPVSPQLTNRAPWTAEPILISGATSYRGGEFLYQDFLYDDNGARHTGDPADERSGGNLFAKQNGTYTYPTNDAYANNAADLVELRVKPLPSATAFRVSLNTLKDPSLVAFSIAIGGKQGETHPFPKGANVVAPADLFLTVHPDGERMVGELTTAGSGAAVGEVLPATVDRERRQVELRIPKSSWDPKGSNVRLAAGIGLWNAGENAYLVPDTTASESTPGGAGSALAPAAFFNVAFRPKEPFQDPTAGEEILVNAAWWRDRDQGTALAAGDISPFFAEVNFSKLESKVRDDAGVPRTGPINRIYASSFELSQGADFSQDCTGKAATCNGQYQGRLQPYAIYVPRKPRPAEGYGLTLLLHANAANYNEFSGTRNQEQYGERGAGSIVITPEARGPDGFYENYAAADVFDVWADAARHYELDPAWTVTSGYSMGGVGSFVLAAQYPDLFARIQPTVGAETKTSVLASLRNVPVLMWNNNGDELANNALFTATAGTLDTLGYRYELDAFQPCANPRCSALFPNHLQLAVNDQYAPAAGFLGTARVERNPAHVTYVLFPERNHPELKTVADHAYWISGLKLAGGAAQGRIDAVSHGFGTGDPDVSLTEIGTGTLEDGNLGDLVFNSQKKTWSEPPQAPKANKIVITTTGISAATIDVRRAGVDCGVELEIESDAPLKVTLPGCNRIVDESGGSGPPRSVSALRLAVSPRRTVAGRMTRFRFTVRDDNGHPASGATVTLGNRRARTGGKGRAVIAKRFARPGEYRARVTRSGHRGARASVHVGRRRQVAFTG